MGSTQSQKKALPAPASSPYSLATWWMQQWLDTAAPLSRVHLAWWESVGDAMKCEAEFIKVFAESAQRLANCTHEQGGIHTPATLSAHYQQVASDVTEAAIKRMIKVSELSHDFRERIWDEL